MTPVGNVNYAVAVRVSLSGLQCETCLLKIPNEDQRLLIGDHLTSLTIHQLAPRTYDLFAKRVVSPR